METLSERKDKGTIEKLASTLEPHCFSCGSCQKTYFFNSLHGLLVSSLFMDILSPMRTFFHFPILLGSMIGGALVGTGIGLMLRQRISTGGTDLLAQFIAEKLSMNVGMIIFIIDGLILLIGHQMIGVNLVYSGLVIVTVGLTTTFITLRRPINR